MQTTWDWVMNLIGKNGWPLFNVVGAIWSVAGNTISAVKSVATDPLNALKIAEQFILNTVFGPIIEISQPLFV